MKSQGTMFNFKWIVAIMAALFIVIGIGQTAIALDAEDYPLGDVPLDQATYQQFLKPMSEGLTDAAPAAYDARDDNIVTPAKDQGGCGSCWAFASVGAMESHILKQGGSAYDLSEQQQNRCNLAMGGCMGGSSTAPQYWETNGPITEACYPYTATDGACDHMCTEMDYRVTGFYTVTQTPLGFKDSCYDDGPSYWRYDVYGDFYDYWNGGSPGDVYTQTTGSRLGGHAVLIIGWDDAKGAYLCKNSWGQNAGPNGDGTFWIAYTGHANDLGFAMSNFNITGGLPSWRYCFTDSNYPSVSIELNKEGKQLRGQATLPGDASFPAPITGYIYDGYALFAINYLGVDAGFRFYKIHIKTKIGETWGVWDSGEFYDTPHSATLGRCSALPDNSGGDSGASDGLGSGDALDAAKTYCLYASDWPTENLSIIVEQGILRGQNIDPSILAPLTGTVVGDKAVFAIGYLNDNVRMYQVYQAGLSGTGWAISGADSEYYHTPHPITLSQCPIAPFELGDHATKDSSEE